MPKSQQVLSKILHGDFAKQVQLLVNKAETNGTLLKGQQIAWHIKDNFRISVEQGPALNFTELISVTLANNDVQKFMND